MSQTAMLFDSFDPLPRKARHYVPVVQDKPGEREALARLDAAPWSRVTPVFCFVGDKEPRAPLTDSRVRDWSKRAESALGSHPFYADFLRQDPSMYVSDGTTSWTLASRAYERLRKRELQFVPVFRELWSRVVADHIAAAHDADGRGAGLRIRLDNTITHSLPLGKRLDRAVALLDVAVKNIDLMVDFGYLDCEGEPDLDGVLAGLETAVGAADWRNVVVIGTTMPSALGSGIVQGGTVGSLPRHERAIYEQLAGGVAGRPVVYGDYAVQHPDPPHGGGPGFRPNIRYTTADQTLVARGDRPFIEVGNQSYAGLCAQLAARPEFAGPGFSWGDTQLTLCADGAAEPGTQAMWRGVGTSHHIAQVLAELN